MNDYHEGKKLPAICDITKKNGALIADISAGIRTLLELLVGPASCGDIDVAKQPDCLLDDVMNQESILRNIYSELAHVIAVLQGGSMR